MPTYKLMKRAFVKEFRVVGGVKDLLYQLGDNFSNGVQGEKERIVWKNGDLTNYESSEILVHEYGVKI